ncbi:MAG: FkbM family methyltransferase [Endomicrobia bacterium]|nr:FkbM family methyltransferase [Bacillota bacterium]MCL1971417.1 FkbM family methyltransferase [Endomicrobiia bacterium]
MNYLNRFIEKLHYMHRAWSYRLIKEVPEIKAVLNNIKKGDIVIDIGAHKGAYTCWMLKAAGKNGKVFAFEPQPVLADYLRKIFNPNLSKNVFVEQVGLSSCSGELELTIPENKAYSHGASLEAKPASQCYSYKVPVDTIDNYFISRNFRPVKFIKCDVEGHELAVFKGAETILKQDSPAILFECETRQLFKHSIEDVFGYLNGLGYSGKFFLNKKLHPLSEFNKNYHQVGFGLKTGHYVENFLFTKT